MSTDRLEWFKENSRYFHIRLIEEELGFSIGTIQKWIKGERNLNSSRVIAMEEFVCRLTGFMISTDDLVINSGVVNPIEVVERFEKELKKEPIIIKKPKQVKEVLKTIVVDKVINKVDISTGEIKENKVIRWQFNGLDKMDRVEGNIFTDGSQFAVMKYFGNIKKYVIIDSIEEARELVNSIK
jgi:hypothetical protein